MDRLQLHLKQHLSPHQYGSNRSVAVKVFLKELDDKMDRMTISELLEISKEPRQLVHSYREIRQEVAFLSALEHRNLAELDSVRIHPFMCLLLELAPQKSLRNLLKDYKRHSVLLEPLTLKATTQQVAVVCKVLLSTSVYGIRHISMIIIMIFSYVTLREIL